MTIPCEQWDGLHPLGNCRKCPFDLREHVLAAAIRAEQAQKLAALEHAVADAAAANIRQAEALAAKDREIVVAVAQGHPDSCNSVGIGDEGDYGQVRYSSGKPCDCGLRALLTQEPTP